MARIEQFFAGSLGSSDASEYGLPNVNTRQTDAGVNYYLRDGLKATASYGRQFSSHQDVNVWAVGIAYRFAWPIGRLGNP